MRTTIIRLLLPVALLALASPSFAQSAWVSDQFEITLRSGPSTSNEIRLMLSSGTRLEVLERDAASGYARVRTPGGTEGWVLTRYLMSEPSAREQLETLSSQLSNATSRGSSLDEQLSTVRSEYQQAQQRIRELENANSELEGELEEITSTAANVLAINEENKELRQQLMDSDIQVDALEQENRELSSQTNRYWFLSGGAVLVFGIILGLWLPRIRWQRRSRYDRF